MISCVIFRSSAETELRAAYDWYETREAGLGSEFLRCVESRIQLIRRHPEIFPRAHQAIRQALVRRIPYSIFYVEEAERIVVLSIFHASRAPLKWK